MDPALKQFMNIPIKWDKLAGRTNTGDAQYIPQNDLYGYVTQGKILKFGAEEEEIVAKNTIYLDETNIVSEGDLLTPPTDIARVVAHVQKYYEPLTNQLYLLEVFVK